MVFQISSMLLLTSMALGAESSAMMASGTAGADSTSSFTSSLLSTTGVVSLSTFGSAGSMGTSSFSASRFSAFESWTVSFESEPDSGSTST